MTSAPPTDSTDHPGESEGPIELSRLTPGLLTVVLWLGEESHLLDECVFALAGQNYRPLELVVVAQRADLQVVGQILEQYAKIVPFDHRLLSEQGAPRSDALNRAVSEARGRYLAFLSADQVVYPDHYVSLIQTLSESSAAWALSGFVRAYFDETVTQSLFIRWKQGYSPSEPFDLARFHYNRPICSSLVIDRTRLGNFPLRFCAREGRIENDPLLLGLAALFKPATVKRAPSCEQRISSRRLMEKSAEVADIQMLAASPEFTSATALRLRILAAVERRKTQFRLRLPRVYRVTKEIGNWWSKTVSGRSLREHLERLNRSGR